MRTIPDVLVRATDPEPLVVVIQVKPVDDLQSLGQLMREAVDVAAETGAVRIMMLMLDAGFGPPQQLDVWARELNREVPATLSRACAVELRHSSFRTTALAIAAAGAGDCAWSAYAEDVVTRLE